MKTCLLDTDILSLFLRNHPTVVQNARQYLQEHSNFSFSQITYYEILSGLQHRNANQQLEKFIEFSKHNHIISLTEDSLIASAQVYAELRKKGTPVDDMDLLIAGVAIANNLALVTHNQKHFSKIKQLELQDWTRLTNLDIFPNQD